MTVVEGWMAGKYYATTPTSTDLAQKVLDILADGISINTTAAILSPTAINLKPEVMGNKTEGALLLMLSEFFGIDYVTRRAEGFKAKRGDKLFTFSSARKRMTVIQKLDKNCRVYSKGAAEVMVNICSHYITHTGEIKVLDKTVKQEVMGIISSMASNSLRALALTHRLEYI